MDRCKKKFKDLKKNRLSIALVQHTFYFKNKYASLTDFFFQSMDILIKNVNKEI